MATRLDYTGNATEQQDTAVLEVSAFANLVNYTPAQIATYVENTATDLAGVRQVLKLILFLVVRLIKTVGA